MIDGNGGTVSQSATITITGENDGPTVGAAITATSTEDDAAFNVDLLAGASDPDTSDVLNIDNLLLTGGDGSGVTVNGNTLDIDPSAYDSLDRRNAEMSNCVDLGGHGNIGTVNQSSTITIPAENDCPSARPATTTTATHN